MLKDTYAIDASSGVELRRRVFAGQVVPDVYQLEEGSYVESQGGVTSYGTAAETPPDTPASGAEADEAEAPAPSKSTRRKKASEAE